LESILANTAQYYPTTDVVDNEAPAYVVQRPSKPSHLDFTHKHQPGIVFPPEIGSSVFIDASSPDAWTPKPRAPDVDSQVTPVKASSPLKFESGSCSTSTPTSPAKRPLIDIESELTKQNLYKTEMCRNWVETGQCPYANRCQFAHGEQELRDVLRHPKYKTEICRTFHTTGTCSYGKRCRFVHHASEMRVVDGQDSMLAFQQQFASLRIGSSQSSSVPSSPSYSTQRGEVVLEEKVIEQTVEEEVDAFDDPLATDTLMKKNSTYRLPFFAKLHGWKKK